MREKIVLYSTIKYKPISTIVFSLDFVIKIELSRINVKIINNRFDFIKINNLPTHIL